MNSYHIFKENKHILHKSPRNFPGYYADTLSVAQEVRGNSTVSVKDEARGFHLNNLSYAGPIVMGFGGNNTRFTSTSKWSDTDLTLDELLNYLQNYFFHSRTLDV